MKFTKMHGLGNDYVYVDCRTERVADPPAVARAVSDRHTGVGSDGLILIHPVDHSSDANDSADADVRMEMYNADGSRSEMCGNGLRCVAKYAVEHGFAAGPGVRILTDVGIRLAGCRMDGSVVTAVRVDMGCPAFETAAIPSTIADDRIVDHPLTVASRQFLVTCVSMGNPHAVVFVDDLDAIDLATIGPLFEHAPEFPQRVNVHFVRVVDRDHVTMVTWERGSGITLACGSGACAVAVAGALTGRTQKKIAASLPGGDLEIDWADDDHVYMTGPAVEVFSGDWPAGA